MSKVSGEKRLLLIDGNSIMNRSYFALAGRGNLTAPDGTPTGALHAYLNTIGRFQSEISPTHICTLFDRKEKTFRHNMYDGYKAKRKPMPEELFIQMGLIKEILNSMNQAHYELAGYEADDLIGTFARRGEKEGFQVWILSGDKDDFQLIDDHTEVIMPVTRPGKSVTELYGRAAIGERYGIAPEDFVTLKAIMGDPSDNIPGVRGIGEKGAMDLVQKYKTLDGIYENLENFSESIKKKLAESRDLAYLSYDLSMIDCAVPVERELSDFIYKNPDEEHLYALFARLGLHSQIKKWGLSDKLLSAPLVSDTLSFSEKKPEILSAIPCEEFLALFSEEQRKAGKEFAVVMDMPFPEELSGDAEPFFLFSFSDTCFISVPINRVDEYFLALKEREKQDGKPIIPIGHSLKNRWKQLSKTPPFSSCFDTEIIGYVLNQIEGSQPSFSHLYERATKSLYPECPFIKGEEKNPLELLCLQAEGVSGENAVFQSVWRCILLRKIASIQAEQIKEAGIEELVYEIEMPLVFHLDRMERTGVLVDTKILSDIHKDMDKRIAKLTDEIYELTGETFNIQSPKQLSGILFEKLGLPHGRKSGASGNYSTASEELIRLYDAHPVIKKIIDHRQLTKLDSTFVVGLQKVINPEDGRVHSNFSQAMTQTGRLSSAEPNLQNIPIRTEEGSLIRKAFVAQEGFILVDADYSQIELRLLAHLSGDEKMQTAFLENEDIHINTAAQIFGVPKSEVSSHMRAAAKTVNFSIVYGISDFGLSQDLGISFKEAHRYIEQYYARYPKIREYLDSLKETGTKTGYVKTLYGRRRLLKELASPNRNIRSFGERAAMNTPVQGTAADIMKIAMNRVSRKLEDEKLDARLILQVHDELLVECKDDQKEYAAELLRDAMEHAADLSIPLTVEINYGKSWYECKT